MRSPKSPHRIVLIEDNSADTILLRLALNEQREPYVLELLPDGESALSFVRDHCQGPEPCLIVLDLHLPRYDGVTILKAIRSQPALAHVRVMVLTTFASRAEKEEVLALSVDAYRVKPSDWENMVELARELISICNTPSSMLAAAQPN